MSMLFNDRNRRLRLGFQVGRQSGLRSTNEVVEQLQQQLDAERRRNAALIFNAEQQHKEIIDLLRENAQLRLDAARRDREAAFAQFEILQQRGTESGMKLTCELGLKTKYHQPKIYIKEVYTKGPVAFAGCRL